MGKANLVKVKISKMAKAKTNKNLDEKTIQRQRKIELSAMTLAELEPLHMSKGVAAASVKELLAKAKDELSCKPVTELKGACVKKGLLVGGTKGDLVKRLVEVAQEELRGKIIEDVVAHEAREREVARAKGAKMRMVVLKMKDEKSLLSVQELKDTLM